MIAAVKIKHAHHSPILYNLRYIEYATSYNHFYHFLEIVVVNFLSFFFPTHK